MTTTERQVGNATVLDIAGKITLEHAGELKSQVTNLLGAGKKQIVLQLGSVSYIDSSGLGELVSCHTTATREQGVVKLANLGKGAKQLLIMTKLHTVFSVYDTEAEAVASFS
jgi:anti-sigma B factor antagonist